MPTHSVDQLKRAVLIAEQIQRLQAELNAILGTSPAVKPNLVTAVAKETKHGKKKGGMSAAGRAAIVAAQKARWAKIKGEATTAPVKAKPATAKKKKTMSPEARAKIAAAAKKRWAAIKAGK